jgi:hypothetical protein
LVSIGDSIFERNAAHFAGKEYTTASVQTGTPLEAAILVRIGTVCVQRELTCRVDAVKFIDPWEGPTITQLGAQLRCLSHTLRETIERGESIDLEMGASRILQSRPAQYFVSLISCVARRVQGLRSGPGTLHSGVGVPRQL